MNKYRLASITGLLAIALVFNVNAAHAAAGSLDPMFGNGGIVLTSSGGGVVTDAVLQADGKIVVQGQLWSAARFLSDGAVDTGFRHRQVRPGSKRPAPISGAVALSVRWKNPGRGSPGNSLTDHRICCNSPRTRTEAWTRALAAVSTVIHEPGARPM